MYGKLIYPQNDSLGGKTLLFTYEVEKYPLNCEKMKTKYPIDQNTLNQ